MKEQTLGGSHVFWREKSEEVKRLDPLKGLNKPAVDKLFSILSTGFDPDEIWFSSPRERNSQKFYLHQCMGTHEILLGKHTVIQTREDSIFGLCLRRREIMVIRDATHKQLQPHLPSWYREKVDLKAFVLCGVHHNEIPVGLIYVGWKEARNFRIQTDKVHFLAQDLRAYCITSHPHASKVKVGQCTTRAAIQASHNPRS